MVVKVTFSLDEQSIARLNQTAARLGKPKSEVVREAIAEFHAKSDRLSEADRLRMLRIVDEMATEPPTRSREEAEREKAEVRRARRSGGRIHSAE